jgi:hypothetical protein
MGAMPEMLNKSLRDLPADQKHPPAASQFPRVMCGAFAIARRENREKLQPTNSST